MIKLLARLAAGAVVLVPVLAFTGDIDSRTAINAIGVRSLIIVVVLGFMLFAMDFYYRHRDDEIDEE
ncbi:MAG TPA: hypothetical protein VFS87_01820 [Qipengyuania sp.]|nr:hypothetical protein [Qipengyuania sp.]